MTTSWRERGFVEDSDEDEDLERTESLDSNKHVSRNHKVALSYSAAAESQSVQSRSSELLNTDGIARIEKSRHLDSRTHNQPQDGSTELLQQDGIRSTSQTLEHKNDTDELQHAANEAMNDASSSIAFQAQELDIFDISSSPLSEPPESVSPPEDPSSLVQAFHSTGECILDGSLSGTLDQEAMPRNSKITDIDHSNDLLDSSLRLRNFRKRNPIQLHPYALENEQYRQTLRARGLKPVALHQEHTALSAEENTKESQYQGAQEAHEFHPSQYTDSQHEDEARLSPIRQSLTKPSLHRTRIIYDEDGFPDLDDMVSRGGEDFMHKTFKRQKLRHDGDSDLAQTSPNVQVLIQTPKTPIQVMDVFECSGDAPNDEKQDISKPVAQRKRRAKKFRFPKALQLGQLPTPAVSSESARVRLDALEFDEESDVDPSRLPPSPDTHSSRSISEERLVENQSPSQDLPAQESSSESEAEQLRSVRRKIKSVLPASWLRLDRQAKYNLPANGRLAHIRSDPSPRKIGQRGVAQKVFKSPSTVLHAPERLEGTIQLSSNGLEVRSSGSKSSPLWETPETRISRPLSLFDLDNDTQDIAEDNTFDAMLPAQSRANQTRTSKKSQTRLTHVFNRPDEKSRVKQNSSADSIASDQRKKISRLNLPSTQRSKKPTSKRLQMLGILDVNRNSSKLTQPDFVRLACRQARQQTNKGRQTVSGKYISLHSWEDQTHIDAFIGDWRLGRVKVAADEDEMRAQERTPLSEKRESNQNAAGFSVNKPAEHKALYVKRATKPRLKQSRLQEVFQEVESQRPTVTQAGNTYSKTNNVPARVSKNEWKRPGQLEDLQVEADRTFHTSAFQRNLLALDDDFKYERILKRNPRNPLLDRFLVQGDGLKSHVEGTSSGDDHSNEIHSSALLKRRRRLKVVPKQIIPERDTDFRIVGQDAFLDLNPSSSLASKPSRVEGPVITGLAAFGTRYTTDFGMHSLPFGTFFNHTTFVGSGGLKHVLEAPNETSQSSRRSISFACGRLSYSWSVWNEDVSDDLVKIVTAVEGKLTASDASSDVSIHILDVDIYTTLAAVSRYYSHFLTFYDPIDVVRCIDQSQQVFQRLLNLLNERLQESTKQRRAPNSRDQLNCLMFVSVIFFKLDQISKRSATTKDVPTNDLLKLFTNAVLIIFSHVLESGMDDVCSCFSSMFDEKAREEGIGKSHASVEALVVSNHLVESMSMSIWDLVNTYFSEMSLDTATDVTHFERAWRSIFVLQPITQFDSIGISQPTSDAFKGTEIWEPIKFVLHRIFAIYTKDASGIHSKINAYIRACLSRCYILVKRWKHYRSESMLNICFDFFAQNGLSLLRFEENRGGSSFLEEIEYDYRVSLKHNDHSFDIFLKLLYSSLISMRDVYSDKKIRNIVWRFIPNHGRLHDKENDLQEEDLDALRNHHNILSTIYFASPASFRPSLSLIRRLVNFKSSHAEVCRLNVKSWSNIMRFFLSMDHPDISFEELFSWCNDVLLELVSQHKHARTEAEMLIAATANDAQPVLKTTTDPIVASNQEQVESVLTILLSSIKELVKNAKNPPLALNLFENTKTGEIFKLFDPSQPQINDVLSLTADLYQTYGHLLVRRPPANPVAQQDSEESQDYGEFPSLEEMEDIEVSISGAGVAGDDKAFKVIQATLSNVFGAERFHDETLLKKLADTWIAFCHVQVISGRYEWNDYIDQHNSNSWLQLRDTDSTRKFLPYVVSEIVKLDDKIGDNAREHYLASWLVSLVDRDSMLKYQHTLTSTLLNLLGDTGVLKNLPFVHDLKTGTYHIELRDLRARRLGLLSQVLLNIRNLVEEVSVNDSSHAQETRNMYTSILRQMMAAMKKNFQETQQSATRGAYVDFVQHVVEYLEQYTSEICPVDRFFTDSSAFPLPSHDPTYVVARLKGYGFKLSDERVQKKLAVFVQAICERAIVENQQAYLIDQFTKSVEGEFYDDSDTSGVKLRQFLLEAVLPAYLSLAINPECGWIFAISILETSSSMIKDLLSCFDLTSAKAARQAADMVITVLNSLQRVFDVVLLDKESFRHNHSWTLFTSITNACTASLSVIDYVYRAFPEHDIVPDSTLEFLLYAAKFLDNVSMMESCSVDSLTKRLPSPPTTKATPLRFGTIKSFCEQELHETLVKSWRRNPYTVGDETQKIFTYWVLRGSSRRQIFVQDKSLEEARSELSMAVRELVNGMKTMPSFCTSFDL